MEENSNPEPQNEGQEYKLQYSSGMFHGRHLNDSTYESLKDKLEKLSRSRIVSSRGWARGVIAGYLSR